MACQIKYVAELRCDRNGCREVWLGDAVDNEIDAFGSALRQARGAGWIRYFDPIVTGPERLFCREHAAPES